MGTPKKQRRQKSETTSFQPTATQTNVSTAPKEETEGIWGTQEWLSFVLEATEDGVWEWDFQSDRVRFSPRFTAILGMPATIQSISLYDIIDRVHPNDVNDFLDLIREARSQRLPVLRHEMRLQKDSGEYVWLLFRGKVLSALSPPTNTPATTPPKECKRLRAVGTVTDISHSKEMEQRLVDLLGEARQRADQDPLTGLYNYGAFHRHLETFLRIGRRSQKSFAVALIDLNNFRYFNDAYGHAVGDEVLRRVAAELNSIKRPPDVIARLGGDEFALLMPDLSEEEQKALSFNLCSCLQKIGYKPAKHESEIPLAVGIGLAFFPYDGQTPRDLLAAADENLKLNKQDNATHITDEIRETIAQLIDDFAMLDALVAAVDNKDRYTRRHSEDVLLYSLIIANEMNLPEGERATLTAAALLHDVGKIGVASRILSMPGSLSPEEYTAMKMHPELGAALIRSVNGLEATIEPVLYHHERWDGTGYPKGLVQEEIPLLARILAVADSFSAMTTDRPYRRGLPTDEALQRLQKGVASQWDPSCVHSLCHALQERPDYLTILKTSRDALNRIISPDSG